MKIKLVAFLFFAIQIVLVFYARFTPLRYFCWAPFDEHTTYSLDISINNTMLNEDEIEHRYRIDYKKWEQRSIYNLIDLIKDFEDNYSSDDQVEVELKYVKNGHQEKTWSYQKMNQSD